MERTFVWRDQTYRVADRMGLAPLMRFAKVAKQGTDANDMDGLAAMYDLLEQCFVDTAEFDRWMDAATAARADQDEILEVVKMATEAVMARPTERPSPSPAGPSTTSTSTAAAPSRSPEQVQRDLERSGRPDLALIVAQAQEARTA